MLPLNAKYRNAPVTAYIKSSTRLPSPAQLDAEGNYSLNQDGINAIKSELSQGHGVTIALCASHPGFNSKKHASYYSGTDRPDHAVTVVGYDDDYSKDNFSRTTPDGKVMEETTPPENGALIIKNSWGLTTLDENDADDGYVYISYYDHSLMSAMSCVFDGGSSSDTASQTATTAEIKTNLSKPDMTKWKYNSDDDIYFQTGILYCETPADEKYDRVKSVDFETVWAQGHTEAERTGDATANFIAWINSCVKG